MNVIVYLSSVLVAVVGFLLAPASTQANSTYLTATALVTDSHNNSAFECWQLCNPFMTTSTPGQAGTKVATVGNITNGAYTVLPPRFNGGIHVAPAVQYGILHVQMCGGK